MISSDQPQHFPDNLIVGISSVEDGDMKFGIENDEQVRVNREKFLAELGMSLSQLTVERVTYDTDDFLRYQRVVQESPDVMTADGLATDCKEKAIFLPLADCVGAVLYDPRHKAFMLSHLGRHSIEQSGGQKSVEFMSKQFDSRPAELQIWLGPAPNGREYPLWNCDNRSFHEELTRQLGIAGATLANIEISPVDTTQDTNYFSHSEFLKGNRERDGRYAIVAQMR